MGAADVLEIARAGGAARALVLEQLEVVAEAGEVRDPDVRVGDAGDHLVRSPRRPPDRRRARSRTPVEGQRAVDVGDAQREMVHARDHRPTLTPCGRACAALSVRRHALARGGADQPLEQCAVALDLDAFEAVLDQKARTGPRACRSRRRRRGPRRARRRAAPSTIEATSSPTRNSKRPARRERARARCRARSRASRGTARRSSVGRAERAGAPEGELAHDRLAARGRSRSARRRARRPAAAASASRSRRTPRGRAAARRGCSCRSRAGARRGRCSAAGRASARVTTSSAQRSPTSSSACAIGQYWS